MTDAAAKLAEIQTTVVREGSPEKSLYLQGKVEPDERNIAELTARYGGRIEKLFVNYTGQQVKKGQKLLEIYSPDLVTAQQELLLARDNYNSLKDSSFAQIAESAKRLLESSRKRLQ
jgi:multidrug efflux pump subunit AcrA (membrane-fusion protein)